MRSGKEDGKKREIMISEAKKSIGVRITFLFANPGWNRTRSFSVATRWSLLTAEKTVRP